MNATACHYTDDEAISLFDEAACNRNESQAIAIIRAAQSGNTATLMTLVRALIAQAEPLDADYIDAKRDEENEACDRAYDAFKDLCSVPAFPSLLRVQVTL